MLAVLSGARRFSDIRVAVPGVSDRLLCDRLRRLEAEGFLERHAATDPGLVGYAPT
ncbi:winged helix-turn-helix transcriptional regulator [Nocardioides sp. T2.26MG-1]|uniref:winged helix-turn-helix transcriptional regulator n=1 Tax=Nocardioides sp. T2.26MG-1 TaxID=3041166 RepID=UPI002541898B|nr:winged helix-turn-helix transcriptional regulator [Nocardioides sp. T2.26MG-1]